MSHGRLVGAAALTTSLALAGTGCGSSSPQRLPAVAASAPAVTAAAAPTATTAGPTLAGLGKLQIFLDAGGFAAGRIVSLTAAGPRDLSRLAYPVAGPVLSPDHTRIAFSSPRGIGVMTLQGRLLQTIPLTGSCFAGGWLSSQEIVAGCGSDPTWPPGPVTGTWRVMVFSLAAKQPRVLAMTDPGDPPSASPGGGLVTYGLHGDVYVVPAAGGRSRLLLRQADGVSWSADGQQIAYAAGARGAREIRVADRTGRHARTVCALPDWTDDLVVAFTPDSRSLLYSGSADTPHPVWIVDSRGGTGRPVTVADYGDPSLE